MRQTGVFDAFFILLGANLPHLVIYINVPLPPDFKTLINNKTLTLMKQKLFRLMLAVLAILLVGNIHLQAKKVHTLGDSTMAPYDESATNTRGWGMYFGNFLTNGWTSVNYAKGGRDSRGGYNELWQNAKNSVEAGDYVLIQFAHNDGKYNGIDNLELQEYYTNKGDATNAAAVKNDGRGTTPSTTYKQCLAQIINAVKEKGATPILVSAVCRCYFGSDNKITRPGRHDLGSKYDAIVNGEFKSGLSIAESDHTMDYSYQMQQLATELGVSFIDMTTATKSLYESYGNYAKCYAALFDKGAETDNTHYNLTGALMAARLCAQLMKEKGILADNIEIPTDLSIAPSSADMGDVYVGQSGTKEMTLTGLGLEPATGTINITASEGIQLSVDKQNWSTSLEVSYESGTVIKTFYAKVAATAVGVFNGTVTATLGSKQIVANVTMNAIELGGGTPFTVTWPLTSNDEPAIDGLANAANAKVEGMVKYGNNAQKGLMVSTSEGGAWVKAEDDSPNQYVQFTMTCPDATKLDINHIAMKVGGHGGGGMKCHVYYSTDGFVTRTTIYAPALMASGVMNDVDVAPVIKLEEGDQLQIRVYPWYTSNATGKWLCVSNVVVEGQAKDAAGVNIPGTITYKLDKGGLNQGDDVVMDPNELSAGFAGKTWSAGAQLTVSGTQVYQGAAGETNITQTFVGNSSGSQTAGSANADNTMTLTLTPEDGFSFVPTRLSFQAARYGTDGGNIGASVDAGETHVDLVTNAGVNRSGKSLTIASFSEEISGVTATADNPLKVNFSFLTMNDKKSMGLSNVVIEGTLVGAAAQVTKYVLSTPVEPAEAGSVSRDPDLEQYKEGTVVTLKATKNFGYKFKEWQDATGAQVSTEATTTVTMDAEKTMKAVFETVPVYTVTTDVTNDADRDLGSITLTPNDHDGKYEAGTKITAVANESKIIKFLNWADANENNNAGATREVTVSGNMMLVANYEVQDFIAVFDASTTANYAYSTTAGYPFAADVTWDNQRNAKASVVKISDGSLCYTNDGKTVGTAGTPVVRNRQSVVISQINGLYQNGYHTADIAWQYQFSTKGFTAATFMADMCAKNAATKQYKALISVDGSDFTELKAPWEVTANVVNPIEMALPAEAIGKEQVVIRITGVGDELYSTSYPFDKTFDGLRYSDHSESGVGNVYVMGEAVVVPDQEAPVITATIPAPGATGVSATGKITISFNEKIQAGKANGVATLNGEPMDATWSNRSVSFSYNNLDYNTQYTFQMPAGFVEDKSGNAYMEAVSIAFTTMNRPSVTKGNYDAVVSTTEELSAAINAANSREDKNTRYRIFVKKGLYKLPTGETKHYKHTNGKSGAEEVVYWEGDLPDPITYIKAANISLIGEDREATIITQDITNDADMLFNGQFGQAHKYETIAYSPVLQLEGSATGMYFQDITIKSGINDALGRNLAIQDKASKTIYKNTLLYGYQDTWTSNNNNGLYYFEDGQVRGRTDYLCGKGDAYFKNLELLQIASGYAAVPSTPAKVGWVFKDCTFSAEGSGVDGTYTLGRPWGQGTPVAVFIDTKMNVVPKTEGWNEMSGGWPKRFAEFHSVNSKGAAVDLSGRKTIFAETHQNNPVLTADEAADYSDMTKMFGDWQPTLATEQAPVPTNVVANVATLTWTGSDYALLYAVCKDGNVVGFTTETTFTVKENGSYAVRAANEMGGLSALSQAVQVTEATGIETVNRESGASVEAVYTIDGKRIARMQHGLNIVRMSDGTVRKVLVK